MPDILPYVLWITLPPGSAVMALLWWLTPVDAEDYS